jgi:GST-like protein
MLNRPRLWRLPCNLDPAPTSVASDRGANRIDSFVRPTLVFLADSGSLRRRDVRPTPTKSNSRLPGIASRGTSAIKRDAFPLLSRSGFSTSIKLSDTTECAGPDNPKSSIVCRLSIMGGGCNTIGSRRKVQQESNPDPTMNGVDQFLSRLGPPKALLKGRSMIELLTWATPNGTKPSIMLEEVNLPYSVRLVNLGSGEQRTPGFLAVSPNNKIPAIIDHVDLGEPRTIFESGAILIYLAEKTGQLLAESGPRRDQALSWLFWSMTGVGPTFGQLLHFVSSVERPSAVIQRFADESARLMRVLDKRLRDVPFLAQDYSIADIGAFTWVKFALATVKSRAGEALGETPGIDLWLETIASRAAVQRGLRAPKLVIGPNKQTSSHLS